MAEQGAETKSPSSSFALSTPFAFKPLNDNTSLTPKVQSGQSFGSLFQPKNQGVDQPAPPASTLFQPSVAVDKEASQEQPAKAPAAIFKFIPTQKEPEKKRSDSPASEPLTATSNPFAALKPAEKSTADEAKPVTPSVFGAPPGATQTQSIVKGTEEKTQGVAPFNPFTSSQSDDRSNNGSHSPTRKSVMNSFQPSGTKSSTLFSPFQPFKGPEAEKTQVPTPFNPFQSLKSANVEKAAEEATRTSTSTSTFISTSKISGEVAPNMATSTPKFTSNNNSAKSSEGVEDKYGVTATSPPKTSTVTPTSTSVFNRPQSMKIQESPSKVNGAPTDIVFGPTAEQLEKSNIVTTPRAPSQTSNLFARSLGQASSAPTLGGESVHSQSHALSQEHSPTKAISTPQKTMGYQPIIDTLAGAASNPLLVKVKSHGASNVPQQLNNDDFADFDKSYRLHNLNAKLKKQIAELDPSKHDFEPIIRFYATQRAAIGYPIGGLYHRAKAGEKRKIPEATRDEPVPNAAKRARIQSSAASLAEAERPVFSFSAITSVSTTPQPATAAAIDAESRKPFSTFNTSTIAPPAPTTSQTSNVFKSILSSSEQPSSHTPESPGMGFPLKAPTSISSSQPQKHGASQPSAPSMSTFTNDKTPSFQTRSQPNMNVTPFSATNGSPVSSQLFQPKPAKGLTLELPKFASGGGADFMNAFAAQAKKNAAKMEAENKAKRKAEEFDSDEDDEAEYERRVAEEDRAKRAKIEALSKTRSGFTPVLSSASSANGVSPAAVQDKDSNRDSSGEESGLFENSQESDSGEGGNEDAHGDDDHEEDEQAGEETDEDDDIQTAMAKSHAKAKNPFDASSDPNSLFNRISRPDPSSGENGSTARIASPAANNSVPSAPLGTGLFGSRPTTPNHDSPKPFGTSIFSNVGSDTLIGDNTWKPGSAIKFGSPTAAPAVNITPATPHAKTNGDSPRNPFGSFSAAASTASKPASGADNETHKTTLSVFGASSFAPQVGGFGKPTSQPFGSLFGDSKKTMVNQSSAAQVGFSFGGPHKPGASPHLAPSNVSSAITSRATSPGLTDNESAAESAGDDHANEPQPDYMASRPGEENEDVLFEVRAKVLEYKSEKELSDLGSKEESGWKTRGLGPLRVLRNSKTGRSRIVMRSEPGANVLINSPLIQESNYEVNPSGKEGASLKIGVFMDGKLKTWVLKLKTIKIANELVGHLKANEPSQKAEEMA